MKIFKIIDFSVKIKLQLTHLSVNKSLNQTYIYIYKYTYKVKICKDPGQGHLQVSFMKGGRGMNLKISIINFLHYNGHVIILDFQSIFIILLSSNRGIEGEEKPTHKAYILL